MFQGCRHDFLKKKFFVMIMMIKINMN
jgi:hypothetical protein